MQEGAKRKGNRIAAILPGAAIFTPQVLPEADLQELVVQQCIAQAENSYWFL